MIWIIITTSIGLYSEIGQYLKMVSGTFDKKDFILIIIAIIIPILFLKNVKYTKTKKYEIN